MIHRIKSHWLTPAGLFSLAVIALCCFGLLWLHASMLSGAEAVYVTPNGKTFHNNPACMALAHSATVYSVDRFIAEAHGLKQCGICYRPSAKKATTKKSTARNDWAKGGQ